MTQMFSDQQDDTIFLCLPKSLEITVGKLHLMGQQYE